MTDHDFALTIELDGQTRSAHVDPGRALVDVLREEFGRTGTHVGCRNGDCGACTVLIDGQPYKACLMPCARVNGRHVETVQGLATDDELHPVQQAFWAANAFQCGFCLAGHMLCAVALLRSGSDISDEDIEHAIAGNLPLHRLPADPHRHPQRCRTEVRISMPEARSHPSEDARLIPIADGVWAWIQSDGSWWINNAGLIGGPDGDILVDTCATDRRTTSLLDAVADQRGRLDLRFAVNTRCTATIPTATPCCPRRRRSSATRTCAKAFKQIPSLTAAPRLGTGSRLGRGPQAASDPDVPLVTDTSQRRRPRQCRAPRPLCPHRRRRHRLGA